MFGERTIMSDYEIRLPNFEGLPELPSEIDEYFEITAWHVAAGDAVQQGQPFIHIETDDIELDLSVPVTGKIVSLAAQVGDKIKAGDLLAIFDVDLSENGE